MKLILICIISALICTIQGNGMVFTPHHPIIIIIGTRPEAIKMMPVYKALKHAQLPVLLCNTGQHADMVHDILSLFEVKADIELNCMKQGQDLFDITQAVLAKTKEVFNTIKPSLVLVQGDTTSAFAAGLAAFYLHIPVGHVEAGLRTGNVYAPFPEEFNRSAISLFAQYHFAPTQRAVQILRDLGVNPKTIFCTGNTVVDALQEIEEKLRTHMLEVNKQLATIIHNARAQEHKIMLLTAHRRESVGQGFISIFNGIKQALNTHKNITIIYPRHPNPAIKQALQKTKLEQSKNIYITEPLNYKDLVYVLSNVDGVMTDSGGLQEEALSLGKPVFVLREHTERSEGLETGLAKLIGTDTQAIYTHINIFMETRRHYRAPCLVYGDGQAAQRILAIIQNNFSSSTTDFTR